MGLRLLTKSMALAVVTSLMVSSCLTEDDAFTNEWFSVEGQPMILGSKLQNPFSVTNMRLAYEKLIEISGSGSVPEIDIRTTHWYVRFLPEDELAFDKLISDTTLNLTDHPIDYEIIQEGDFYHDPSIPAGSPTYQYATVPVNFVSSTGIPYEILDELYLPNKDLPFQLAGGRSSSQTGDLIDTLEDLAFDVTGNNEEDISQGQSARKKSKWYPAGQIIVWDSRLNDYIPMEGVKVQARRWFDVKEAYTDASGNYKMNSSFRHRANYRIIWERDKFDVRSGTFGQAKVNGPKKSGNWNVKIERSSMAYHYAHVFRAALRYYYGDIGGLARPSFRIKYSVFNKRGKHMARNLGNWSVFGINPNILIYRYSSLDGSENDSDEMFSMTCHETAHTTHMQKMNGGVVQFVQVSEAIRESWAIGVEWFITQKEYKERGITNYAEASYNVSANYPTLYGFQFWDKRRNPDLTSLFIDLVDNHNQRGQAFRGFSKGTVSDPVTGYTFAGLESGILKDVYGLRSLGEKLKQYKPAEVNNQQLDIFLKNF